MLQAREMFQSKWVGSSSLAFLSLGQGFRQATHEGASLDSNHRQYLHLPDESSCKHF